VERGRMLLRRAAPGDAARARTVLDEARRSADGGGFGGVSRQAGELVSDGPASR
jgi:hypothetical protein